MEKSTISIMQSGLSLNKIHTSNSAKKTIILTVFLAELITKISYNSKTDFKSFLKHEETNILKSLFQYNT